jgi:tetratricopeptide (TPR) repeat protein
VRIAALIAILTLALGLRLAYLNQVVALPFFDHPIGESAEHLKSAARIAGGELIPTRPFFYASVFYPYFLAAVLGLPGGSLALVALLQILAGVLLVFLIARLGERVFGPAAGLVAAGLAALYGPLAFLEADILGIVWGLVFLVAALLGCLSWSASARSPRRGIPMRLLGAGLALGLAATERLNLVALVPLIAIWCATRTPRRLRAAGALLMGALLPLAAVGVLNHRAAGDWVPLATSRGVNLWIGNHPGADGTYAEPWAAEHPEFAARHTELEEASIAMAERLTGRTLTPEQASSYWAGRALDHARQHPLATLAVTARKVALLLNAAEIPNHLNYEFLRERAPALRALPIGFAVVLPLALLGWAVPLGGRRREARGLLLLTLLGIGASILPFFVTERYRAPMLPLVIVLAGAGVVCMGRWVIRREAASLRRLAWSGCAALALLLVSLAPLTRPLRSRDWWMFAQAYEARGDWKSAAGAYRAALAEEGDDGELLNNLAQAYRRMGRPDLAEAALRTAIRVAPGLALPHRNLGMLLIGRGALAEAAVELEASLRLEPDDPRTLGALAALSAERGDLAGAARRFARARAIAPGDASIARLERDYLGAGPEPRPR